MRNQLTQRLLQNPKRWALALIVIALPLVLMWLITAQNSWRPRVLQVNQKILALTFSPDGTRLACSGSSAEQIWNVRSGQLLRNYKSLNSDKIFFCSKNKLVTFDRSWNTWLWNFGDKQPPKSLVKFTLDSGVSANSEFIGLVTLKLLEDCTTLVYTGLDNWDRLTCKMFLYDASNGKLWHKLEFALPASSDTKSYTAVSLECSPDGATIAAGYSVATPDIDSHTGYSWLGGEVWVWDKTGHLKYKLTGHTWEVDMLAFSSQDYVLASACSFGVDNSVRIWDLRTGKLLHLLPPQSLGIRKIVFAPDGQTLLVVSEETLKQHTLVMLWDMKSGKLRRTIVEQKSEVSAVAFSSDGSDLAIASANKTIKLFRVK